jgi:rod shape determining protein RodA
VVELLGFVGMGARRWVDLYVFQIQPSELIKIALVLALAAYFHNLNDRLKFHHLIIPTLLILLPSLLVLRQPDLGTAMILLLVGGSIFYGIGVRLWFFTAGLLGTAGLFPVLWKYLKDYQKKRIFIFLNPEQDPLGSGYHILQSKIAIGSGGFWGKGFNQGTQSRLDFLPEKQTDFIFTMLCEEWGFVGGLTLIGLYIMFLIKCFRIALEARYTFNCLVAVGVTSMLFFHVFINIGMVIGVLPVVGVPLPFMSYGGTSMLTLMIGLGLIGAVSGQKETRLSSYFKPQDKFEPAAKGWLRW